MVAEGKFLCFGGGSSDYEPTLRPPSKMEIIMNNTRKRMRKTRRSSSEQATSFGYAFVLLLFLASCQPTTSLQFVAQSVDSLNDQVVATMMQPTPTLATQLTTKPKQVELMVQPNSPVRIECRLPALVGASNKTRTFYWNFQRTSTGDQKPDLLAYGTDHIQAQAYGIELDFDQASGTYDLIIQNATYELNDGIYYCDFRDTAPDSRVTLNREFRLTVLIPPQAPTISTTSAAPAREGQEYQLSCVSFGGNPEPQFQWFRNELQLSSGSGVRLEQVRQNGTTTSVLSWLPTIDDHQTIFKCSVSNKAMSGLAPLERDVTLSVEYAPRISVGPFNPLKVMQGQPALLACQVDANPPVKSIRWFRDGHQLVSNAYNHTLHEVKPTDSAVYSCQADNGIAPVVLQLGATSGPAPSAGPATSGSFFSFMGLSQAGGDSQASKTLVEARLHLEVLYGPRVQVRESRAQPLDELMDLTLNCSVDAWPAPYEFVWSKLDSSTGELHRLTASTSPTLEFPSISAADMGNYTCTAYNRLEPSPTGSGGVVAQGQSTFERQGSASHLVLVRHKPGMGELLAGNGGVSELGNKTWLQCRAKPPGYPEPKYTFWRWTSGKNRHFMTKSATRESSYLLHSVSSNDEARYGCMARNEHGNSSEAEAELVVNEPPTISLDKTWRSEDERQVGSQSYSITIRASGKPEPRVSWFHRSPVDGRRVELSGPEMAHKFRIDTQSTLVDGASVGKSNGKRMVVSTMAFVKPLEIDDRGLYTVEFSNGLSRLASESFQLHIHHAPIPALRHQPIVASARESTPAASKPSNAVVTRLRAGFNLGEQVKLTCRVSAYPQPQFNWHMQSSNANGLEKSLEKDGRYSTRVVNTHDDIWESTLSFELSSESDYGDYLCVTANLDAQTQIMGDTISILIHLNRKSAPEPPVQVEQVDAAQDSVTLAWVPGFDGGFARTLFQVQYAPDDQSGFSLMRRFGPVPTSSKLTEEGNSLPDEQTQSYPKVYDCLSMNPCTINQLQSRTAYLMRVVARNDMGNSEATEDVRVSTRSNVTLIPRIQEAHFDSSKNILRFRVEPNPEYLLNNLEAHIEVRSSSSGLDMTQQNEQQQPEVAAEWRRYPSVPIRHEQGEAYLNMAPDSEQLRLTLCSRSNESLCGPEFVLSTQSVSSSFLRDQQGLSISILASSVVLILCLGALATTLHSCSSSRKAKKAAALDHVDHHANGGASGDNKPLGGHVNGGLNLTNGQLTATVGAKLNGGGSHGSTASTNSTSAAPNGTGQLQSMDSIMNAHASSGSGSDHSTDHSRQAKLDSMMPPNYSHYADRASLMLEQQQQQQQQQQQLGYLQDCKLSSPFGLPTTGNGLLHPAQVAAAAGDHIGDYFNTNAGAYGDASSVAMMTSLEQQPMDAAGNNSMMLNSMLSNPYDSGASQALDSQMYSTQHHHHHQQLVDDYNNYNQALAYQQQQEQQLLESAYGTTGGAGGGGGLMMAQPTQASYDNNTNQSYSYFEQQPPQLDSNSSQYQQDLAAAQQQMYGTLTRNQQQQQQQQQQQSPANQQDAYMSTAGLMPPPPPPPPTQQESDYGTTGRSGGRLIREIIV